MSTFNDSASAHGERLLDISSHRVYELGLKLLNLIEATNADVDVEAYSARLGAVLKNDQSYFDLLFIFIEILNELEVWEVTVPLNIKQEICNLENYQQERAGLISAAKTFQDEALRTEI